MFATHSQVWSRNKISMRASVLIVEQKWIKLYLFSLSSQELPKGLFPYTLYKFGL